MADIRSLLEMARSLTTASLVVGVETEEQRGRIEDFDNFVVHPHIISSCRKLFVDGHYERAVEEAVKALCAHVKEKAGLDTDGVSLMQTAFSEKKPRILLNELADQSQRDEQVGYMHLFMGVVRGIRNPRAHSHDYKDTPDEALRILIFVDHLFKKVDGATVAE